MRQCGSAALEKGPSGAEAEGRGPQDRGCEAEGEGLEAQATHHGHKHKVGALEAKEAALLLRHARSPQLIHLRRGAGSESEGPDVYYCDTGTAPKEAAVYNSC